MNTTTALVLANPHRLYDLPDVARNEVTRWEKALAGVVPPLGRAFLQVASALGVSVPTVRRRFYAAREGRLHDLLDKRTCPELWSRQPESLPKPTIAFLQTLVSKNQRCSSQPILKLQRMWDRREPIPGFEGHPGWPRRPAGFSRRNLYRYLPNRYQLKADRIGRKAAAAHRQLVYTTRKGLWVGSHYMFDDMWHDFFVNTFAENQAGRPLELFSHDLYSARKVRWGLRVRTRKPDGTYNQLEEWMTRYILAATLYLDGYSPRGTVLVVEHGTAAIREDIEKELHDLSLGSDGQPLITVSRSGMEGAAAHAGQYPGISKGNPRHKASLESSNNLAHNALADLPGQTGKDVEHRPEQLDTLLKRNNELLLAQRLMTPERAAMLELDLLEITQATDLVGEAYGHIERSHEHELEGWAECGHVVSEVELAGHRLPQAQILALPKAERATVMALVEAGQIRTRARKMSRREAWDRGSRELIRLPGYGVCAILGRDLATPRDLEDGMFEFEDAKVGPGDFRFSRFIRDAQGREIELPKGKYETFINPFAPDVLFVRDLDGRYLGEAPALPKPCRGDVEAVNRACGSAAKAETAELIRLGIRHAAEGRARAGAARHNARVMGGQPVTPAEKEKARTDRRRISAEPGTLDSLTDTTAAGG